MATQLILSCKESPLVKSFPLLDDDSYPASHFDRLPVELKIEIFDRSLDPYPSFNARWSPLLLSHVSTSWRAIVESTPRLWARFGAVILNDTSAEEERRWQEALAVWLERSRSNPLSICICHSPTGHTPDHRSEQILAALLPHAHRWKDIHLRIPGSALESLHTSKPFSFPELRTLTLETKVSRHAHVSCDSDTLKIPWGQLAELKLLFDHDHLPTLDKCLHILSQCVSLSRCVLDAECTFDNHTTPSQQFVLPALRHFDLSLMGEQVTSSDAVESNLVSFLEQFKFPQLESFSLHWLVKQHNSGASTWSAVHTRFISVLSSMSPTLHSLSLAYLPFSDTELLGCLQHLSSLTHLDLRFSFTAKEHDPITDAFLRACTLNRSKESPGILPLLESMYLQCCGSLHSATHVTELIKSRLMHVQGHARLDSFSLVSMMPLSRDTQRRLKEWAQEGCHVSIEKLTVR